eukprot:354900-Chlamydomonas_euryale.AAC.9
MLRERQHLHEVAVAQRRGVVRQPLVDRQHVARQRCDAQLRRQLPRGQRRRHLTLLHAVLRLQHHAHRTARRLPQLEAVVHEEGVDHGGRLVAQARHVEQVRPQRLERPVRRAGPARPDLLVMEAQLVAHEPLFVLHLLIHPLVVIVQVLLVFPVCGKAVLSDVVHLVRADLHLDRHACLAIDRLVQRLVAVGLLYHAHKVLGALGHAAVELLHCALRKVAVMLVSRNHDAQRNEVVNSVDRRHAVGHHLAPNRVEIFRAARDVLIYDAALVERRLDRRHGRLERRGVLPRAHRRTHRLVLLRVQHRERCVLQVSLDAPATQPVGHHGVDVERLLRERRPCRLWQPRARRHLVHTVSEFDKHRLHVLHRKHHAAKLLVVHLAAVAAIQVGDRRDRRHAVDERDDVAWHELLQLRAEHLVIMQHVSQQARGDRLLVHAVVCKRERREHAVAEHRRAVMALLIGVRPPRNHVRVDHQLRLEHVVALLHTHTSVGRSQGAMTVREQAAAARAPRQARGRGCSKGSTACERRVMAAVAGVGARVA